MENSYRYFCNTACKFYPCHEGLEEFNCLFCFCPFYISEKCPGNPVFLNKEGRIIKDCSICTYPHVPEHYDVIMKWVAHSIKNKEYSDEIRARAIPFEQRPHAHKRAQANNSSQEKGKTQENGSSEEKGKTQENSSLQENGSLNVNNSSQKEEKEE